MRLPRHGQKTRRLIGPTAFKACPPLVTDIDLSVDDKSLYLSCWGTGDLQQYDVSDPFKPQLTGKVRIGGIVARASHPKVNRPLNGGPQMVEISRDGKRIYFTNSLYGAVDPQFYPDGVKGWMVRLIPISRCPLSAMRHTTCWAGSVRTPRAGGMRR